MSVMQLAHRSLLSQSKLASLTFTRMFDAKRKVKIGLRRRRLELMKAAQSSASVPCYMALRRSENRCNQPRLKVLIDECMEDPCGMAPLPLDLDHYTPSDKGERKYQRTWCESYPMPKKFVKPEKCYPNRPRRNLRRNATSVDCVKIEKTPFQIGRFKVEKLIDLPCETTNLPCCRIPTPGCEPARNPPFCREYHPPSCCKKRRTQYPSFSECQPVGLLDPIPPCECEKRPVMCDMYAYWRRHYQK